MTPLRVGTRGSALALAQARWVADRLEDAEIVEIVTSGDRARGVGDKSRWVDTIEAALVAGEIDLAVHSAKDVPGELADGLRARRDAAASRARARRPGRRSWPEGARVGTSSLRRRAQLLAVRPDLDVVELRGNVDTRLRKLDAGEVDAIVLAAAGLERLGLERDVTPLDFVPAPGQGTLAIEARADDERVRAALGAVHDPDTFARSERRAGRRARIGRDLSHARGNARARRHDARLRGAPRRLRVGGRRAARRATARSSRERMLAAGAGELLAQAEAMA